jgi:hypothetical protein
VTRLSVYEYSPCLTVWDGADVWCPAVEAPATLRQHHAAGTIRSKFAKRYRYGTTYWSAKRYRYGTTYSSAELYRYGTTYSSAELYRYRYGTVLRI